VRNSFGKAVALRSAGGAKISSRMDVAYFASASPKTAKARVFWNNIQITRLVAAYGIVYIHLAGVFAVLHASPALLDLLRFGTDLFVVVAGFLSAHVLGPAGKPALVYLRDRAIRLLPLYVIFTLLAFAVSNLLMRGHHSTVPELLMSLAFIPYGPYPVLYPTWMLENIVEFTLIIAIFQAVSRPYGIYLSSVFVVLIVLAGMLSGSADPVVKFWTNPILIDFALGVIVYTLIMSNFLSRMTRRTTLAMALALLGTCATAIMLRPFCWPEVPRLVGLGLPAAGMLLGAVTLEQIGVCRKSTTVNFLAKCSYSIYLCHWFVNIGSEKILVEGGDSKTIAALLLIVTPLLVTYVAIMVHLYIETPITRYLMRRFAI
jgi:exopolysaccharide production protein ExoZ